MLYKEAAIAVMVAVMLGAASIFGGLSIVPALATHDSDAVELATEQRTQGDDESVIIDAIELDAKKLTSRARGIVTVEIIQDGDVRESGTLGTGALKTSFTTIEVDVSNVNVTGSFEILVEYVGDGVVMVDDIGIVEGTEVAEVPDNTNDPDPEPEPNPPEEEVENVIASKTIPQDDDESMTVEVVEFDAKRLTSRVDGTVTVALVQDDAILDRETFNAEGLKTSYTEREAAFDEEITGEFKVVFMFEGDGRVYVSGINVPGATEPADDPPVDDPPVDDPPVDDPPVGTGSIEVYAHRLPSEFWAPNFTDAPAKMWFSLHNSTGHVVFAGWFDETGAYNDDEAETKANINFLDASQTHYIFASGCDECHDDDHDVLFDHWEDGGTDNPRTLPTLSDQHAYYRYDPDIGQ